MASFSNLTLTYSGIQLIHKLISSGGKPLVFTRLGLGDGELADESMIPGMTALINERIRIPVETLEHDPDTLSSCLTVRISSSDLEHDLLHRELGVYVLDQDEKEILAAYGNAGDKYDHLPAADNSTAITKLIRTYISFAPLDVLYKDLPSDLFVTYAAFEDRLQKILPGMVSDSVQEAFSERGNVALTDRANIFTEHNSFTEPVVMVDAVKDNHAANIFSVRGLDTFMASIGRSWGWDYLLSKPYLIENQTVTGTPRDLYMIVHYPQINIGKTGASCRTVNNTREGLGGFAPYMLPHTAFFSMTQYEGRVYRISISRAVMPREELPDNNDTPCFQPVTGPENYTGKFWIEILLPEADTEYTTDPVLGRVREGRVKLNYIGEDRATPILETYSIKIPTTTVFNYVHIRGIFLVRETDLVPFANRKTRVYLITEGSHNTTTNPYSRHRVFLIAEFRAWEHYQAQQWYLSLYRDGSHREFARHASDLILEQPKFFSDSSFSSWIQGQSIDIRGNA